VNILRIKAKKKPQAKGDKKYNQRISAIRIINENIIGEENIFRIIAEKYRNRRSRFELRFNLIAAIYNIKLNHI
jgi:hypothetical protein